MPKKIFFTPGPSALYFTVESHIKDALKAQVMEINHRSAQAEAYFKTAAENLKVLMDIPSDRQVLFLSSATEIWERQLQNLVINTSHHFCYGAFSNRFFDFAQRLGLSPTQSISDFGSIPDLNFDEIPEETELIAFALNETSTGVSFPTERLTQLREKRPNALIAVDGVSAFPVIDIDFSQIDSAYFSVQKCFGLPAGLGVWILSPRAIAKAEEKLAKGHSIGTYQAIPNLIKNALKYQTTYTANVFDIYLLSKVTQDMLERGIDVIRREANYKSVLLQHMVDKHPLLTHFVEDKAIRSPTVTVANTAANSNELLATLKEKGFVLGNGYGSFKGKQIRIASFPTHSKEQIELLVDVVNSIV